MSDEYLKKKEDEFYKSLDDLIALNRHRLGLPQNSPKYYNKSVNITDNDTENNSDIDKSHFPANGFKKKHCKGCGNYINSSDKYCPYCGTAIILSQTNISEYNDRITKSQDIRFHWWGIWAWLNLVFGNLYILVALNEQLILTFVLITVNTLLMIMILKFNKYAFLIATIIHFNPVIWIINGFYLKKRWNHPKVNNLE